MRWLSRIAYWFSFRTHESDLRDELALHRDLLARDFERRGHAATEARAAADLAMGNTTYMREEARAVWLPVRLENFIQDARYAWRGLLRSPAFTFVATSSLALGIGANTAIFSLIDSLLLARVPVPAAAELIEPQRVVGARGIDQRFSRAELAALAKGPLGLSMVVGTSATLDIDGLSATISVDVVDDRYFTVLRLGAARGRVLTAADEASAAPVAVVTDRFWHARMSGDASVLGRLIKLNGQTFTVVGVTPVGFAGLGFPPRTDLTIPLSAARAFGLVRESSPSAPIGVIVGRRPAAWSLSRAETDLSTLWARCCEHGELIQPPRGQIMAPATLAVNDISRGIPQLKIDLRGRYSRILIALMGGVAILLLAACVNVGSLLLARSAARAHELAVRVALGASRARILAQLLVESLELSLLGAAGGVALAWWGTGALARQNIGDLAGIALPTLRPSVLAFTGIVSVVSGIAFGIVPASRIIRGDLVSPIQQSGQRASRRSRGVLDRGLVALQIALALLLVSGAALLTQTLRNLRETDLGFDPERRLVLTVETRRTSYARQGMTAQMAGEMLRAVRALPGVRSAGFASLAPIFGGRSASDNVVVPESAPAAEGQSSSDFVAVSPDYFATLGIAVKRGTDIGAPVAAAEGTLPTQRDVVINETFAKQFFAGRDPLGHVFRDNDDGDTTFTADRVVGVVADARFSSPRLPARPMYFVQVRDHDWPYLVLVVRTTRADAGLGASIMRTIASLAPGIGVDGPTPLAASIDDSLVRERISAALGSLFGAIALSLVAVGLYGVMGYQVTQRTREIGIRMALGAQGRSVVGMVLGQSLTIVAIGLIAGLPLALLAGRAVASQLYGVSAYDLVALAFAATALVTVAIAASVVPARRAVTVDPLESLRAG
jgi:macrolide transport system ATP-binding/permease protein